MKLHTMLTSPVKFSAVFVIAAQLRKVFHKYFCSYKLLNVFFF